MISCLSLCLLILITFGCITIYCIINNRSNFKDLTLTDEEQSKILRGNIAVVGNGPISEEDRSNINKADCVIRFNKLKNYKKGERFDVHATRNISSQDVTDFSGLDLPHRASFVLPIAIRHLMVENSKQLIGRKKLPTILVYQEIMKNVEASPNSRLFPHSVCRNECKHSSTDRGPSIGTVVIDMLEKLKSVKKIDVYGMNWNGTKVHNDFKYPYIVSKYCSKCEIHPTSKSGYY